MYVHDIFYYILLVSNDNKLMLMMNILLISNEDPPVACCNIAFHFIKRASIGKISETMSMYNLDGLDWIIYIYCIYPHII